MSEPNFDIERVERIFDDCKYGRVENSAEMQNELLGHLRNAIAEIADLQVRLADMQAIATDYRHERDKYCEDVADCIEKITDLEAELAEKDAEIERLKKECEKGMRQYMQHLPDCNLNAIIVEVKDGKKPCTCGLEQALAKAALDEYRKVVGK